MTCYECLRKDMEDKNSKRERIQSISDIIDNANTIAELDKNVANYHKNRGR